MKPVNATPSIMNQVLIALVPGTMTMAWFFGTGVVVNITVGIAVAVATEILCLRLRGKSSSQVFDGSAVVSGMLIGLCLPPLLPIWIIIVGVAFAMFFGKHLYGGLGQNPFNPAMVGYGMLIVSFPLAMSMWPSPGGELDWITVLSCKLGAPIADGMTMATPLDAFRFRGSMTLEEFYVGTPTMGVLAGQGWQWINGAFLAGGVYLIYRRACHYLMPATLVGTLALLAIAFYDSGSSNSLGSPVFHLFSGATMLAAFFIITDPVTCPDSLAGKIIFAAGIGILTFIIRSIGAYPDGIAFAVLLMNTAVPFIDQVRRRFA